MKERHKAIPAVYLLLVRGGQLLVALRQNTGYQDGRWNVPSGHVEPGELPTQALIREVMEEIDIFIAPEDLRLEHVSYRTKHDETGDRVDYFFRATHWEGEPKNAEPHKCERIEWVPLDGLPEPMTPHVRHAIECIGRGEFFSELDVEWLKKNGVYMLD